MDDVRGLLPSRKKNSSTVIWRVVAQYLIEMQGLESNSGGNRLLIIATENEPGLLDLAVNKDWEIRYTGVCLCPHPRST